MSSTPLPAGRYGPPADPRRHRRAVVALATLGVAGVALVVWFGLRLGSAPVTWSQVGFITDGPTAVEVTYDVTRPDPAVAVECRVEALNHAFAQVGVVVVDVPAASSTTVRRSTTVQTSEQAVTGVVEQCWVPEE